MAIDSAKKRASVFGIARPWRPIRFVPDSDPAGPPIESPLDAQDRLTIGWLYAFTVDLPPVDVGFSGFMLLDVGA